MWPFRRKKQQVIDKQIPKSQAIPLPAYHIHRTNSELELHEATAVAEYHDQCMFNRLVGGIRHNQERCYNAACHRIEAPCSEGCDSTLERRRSLTPLAAREFIEETDKCIESIISTRNHNPPENVTAIEIDEAFGKSDGNTISMIDKELHPKRLRKNGEVDCHIEGFDVKMSHKSQDSNETIRTEVMPYSCQDDQDYGNDDDVFDIDL